MLSQGGQGTRLGARRAPLGQHHPAKTTPGRAPRRTVGSTGETTPASTTAFAGPAPAGTALAHGPPAPLATAGSLGKRPTDPLPGTQGSPAGSRPLSSTPGALAPAPTHFRVQPPLPPRGPHRHVSHARRRPAPGAPRAAPPGHCACARAPECAGPASPPAPGGHLATREVRAPGVSPWPGGPQGLSPWKPRREPAAWGMEAGGTDRRGGAVFKGCDPPRHAAAREASPQTLHRRNPCAQSFLIFLS